MASPFNMTLNLTRLLMLGPIQWVMQLCNTLRPECKHTLICCDAQALIDVLQFQVEQAVARLTRGQRAQGLSFAEYRQGESLAAYGMRYTRVHTSSLHVYMWQARCQQGVASPLALSQHRCCYALLAPCLQLPHIHTSCQSSFHGLAGRKWGVARLRIDGRKQSANLLPEEGPSASSQQSSILPHCTTNNVI